MSWIYLPTKKVSKFALHGTACPVFRKEFTLKKKVREATLLVSSLGIFKGELNGEEFDGDLLSPGWTNYKKRIPYCEYEITSFLRETNVLDIYLADGWYTGKICWSLRNRYGTYPLKLWAKLVLTYEDGQKETIETNSSWNACVGPISVGDILFGEIRDNRKKLDFTKKASVVVDIYSQKLEKERCERVRKKEVLPAQKIGENLWDTRQNFAGVIRAKMQGERGAKVQFRYAEILGKDGKIYTENLRNARCTDVVILRGDKEETYQPTFTYHGFRYIEVTVLEGKAEVTQIDGLAIHNDLTRTGEFVSSNPLVNQIFSNALWGLRSNFVSVPTDCPQRDERLGWTADAQVFCPTAMYLYDCKKFYEKYMTDIRDAQQKNGGVINVAPFLKFPAILHTSAAWGDAVCVIPYEHYKVYGDKKIILDNLSACKRWVRYCQKRSLNLLRPAVGFGDWLSIGETTDKGYIATAYFAYSSGLVAKMCALVGDKDKQKYEELHEKIVKQLREKYFKNGRVANDTQTAYVLACAFGFMTYEEAKNNLIGKLAENDYLLATGFIGTRYLLPVLCEMGRSDLAYKLLAERRFPSWGYTVDNGATTIWERWDGYRKELPDPFQSASMNSYNHYSFGACIGWVFQYGLGFVRDENHTGKNRILIRPFIDRTGTMTKLSGTFDGIKARWKTDGVTAEYRIAIPEGIDAEFDFGKARVIERKEEGKEIIFSLALENA